MGDRIRDGLRPTAERRKGIESLRAQPNTSRPNFAQRIRCLRAGHQRRSLADSGLQEIRKMQRRFAEGRTVFMPQSSHASHGDVEMSELFRVACNMGLEGLVSRRANRPYGAGRSKDWVNRVAVASTVR
jgi:hypothetical protein